MNADTIAAFYPFQSDLYDLQMKEETLLIVYKGMTFYEWSTNISKTKHNYLQALAQRLFEDKNKIIWVWLHDFNYPWMALYLQEK